MSAQKRRVEQDLCSSERMRSGENHSKVALILGVTGQTGSYLADLLLFKGKSCSYPSEADVTDRGARKGTRSMVLHTVLGRTTHKDSSIL